MCSLKVLSLLLIFLAVGNCEREGGGGHHGHHGVYFHEFYYLIFLALKFKIILVVGSIWTFGLIIAKVFAIFKFAEYMKKHHYHHEDHHEVIYTNPHGPWDYGGKSYGDFGSYPSDVHFDHSSSAGGDYSGASYDTNYAPVIDVDNYGHSAPAAADFSGHERSQKEETGWWYGYLNKFAKMVQRLHVTDLVFNEMKIKSEDCKKKFVCETEYYAKYSRLLKSAFDLLSDKSYQKYRSTKTVSSVDECARLNPKCIENT